jgi:hypothetical protein
MGFGKLPVTDQLLKGALATIFIKKNHTLASFID